MEVECNDSSEGMPEFDTSGDEGESTGDDDVIEWWEVDTDSSDNDEMDGSCNDESNYDVMNSREKDAAEGELLYADAPITVSASYLMLFLFAKKYQLTIEVFQALLELVKTHCPEKNKCATSVYKLKAFFSGKFIRNERTTKIRYCSVCTAKILDGGRCAVAGCAGADFAPVEFYCGDLTPQLKKKMEG